MLVQKWQDCCELLVKFNHYNMNTPILINPIRPVYRFALLSGLVLLSVVGKTQEFITPYGPGITPARECYVVTLNGERIEGKLRMAVALGRGIKSVTMMLPSGKKRKFTADQIREIGFKNNDLTRVISTVEQSASIRKAAETNWEQIYQQEYIVYSQVTLPSGKHTMMQLINPGFDSAIQVYYSLGSRKTSGIGIPAPSAPFLPNTIKLTGGRQRAYWVSKDHGQVIKVKRGNYNKKKFTKLFGDRPEMFQTFGRPYRFEDFNKHVFFYDQLKHN